MPVTIDTQIQEQVVIKFTVDDGNDVFPGALVLKADEYAALDAAGLEAMQMTKYNEWIQARTPPTPEQLVAQQTARLESIPVQREQLTVEEQALKDALGIVDPVPEEPAP